MVSSSLTSGRHAPVAVLAVTLFVFAVVVAHLTLWLRSGLQEQILRREAAALTEVASLQLANEAETMAHLGVDDVPGELLNAVLKTSKLRGVFAVRVFDAERRFAGALPLPWSELPPEPDVWAQLAAGVPLARLHARESAAEVIGMAPASAEPGRAAEPLLETWLPLRRVENAPLAGAAQMWTDGHALATEFAALDRRLLVQAVFAWSAGAVIIGALLGWAFRRLAQANRELQLRSDDLARANRELTLAAKTSALGTITAHLMHELKNPIAGLEEFVAARADLAPPAAGGELGAASELTRRLRTMVNDVAAVMRDEQTGARFELTCAEIAELALGKARLFAGPREVTVESDVAATDALTARRANLAGLVLHNLLQNAVEASAPRGVVRLHARADEEAITFAVEDRGAGLPAEVRARLFQPCASSKRGGSGLGLALSQQLARQAGGRIELARSDATGTCFRLVLDRGLRL